MVVTAATPVLDQATSFTTSGKARHFIFTGLQIHAAKILFNDPTPTPLVKVHRDDGGRPAADPQYTLINPGDFLTANSSQYSQYTFSAREGATLDPGTKYWVVFSTAANDYAVDTTADTTQTGEGWTIGDGSLEKKDSGVWAANADTPQGPARIAIFGTTVHLFGAELDQKVLVSNYFRKGILSLGKIRASGLFMDQYHSIRGRSTRAGMPFTTGPDAGGYELGMVRLGLYARDYEFQYGGWGYADPNSPKFGKDRNIPRVSIWSNGSGGNPGARLHTLAGSRDLSQHENDFYTEGFTLKPRTTYWVVVENLSVVHHLPSLIWPNNTRSIRVDAFINNAALLARVSDLDHFISASGWTIGNSVKEYLQHNYGGTQWCYKSNVFFTSCNTVRGAYKMRMALFARPDASEPFFRDADGNSEADPVILHVPEDMAGGGFVGQLAYHDLDREPLTFSVGGDSAAFDSKFLLNERTGEITLKPGAALDHETTPAYTFDVTLTDSEDSAGNAEATPTVDDTVRVTIRVTDIAEPIGLTVSTYRPAVGQELVATLADPEGSITSVGWYWRCAFKGDLVVEASRGDGVWTSSYTPQARDQGCRIHVFVEYEDSEGVYWKDLFIDRRVAPVPDVPGDRTSTVTAEPGDPVKSGIGSAHDRDWFRMPDISNERVYLMEVKGADTEDGTLTNSRITGVYDIYGNLVRYSGVPGQFDTEATSGLTPKNAAIMFTPPARGTHFLEVTGDEGATGTYTVLVRDITDTTVSEGIEDIGGVISDHDTSTTTTSCLVG